MQHALKTIILGLPTLGMSKAEIEGAKKPVSFTKLVSSEGGKLETLLKVLLSPPEEVICLHLWPCFCVLVYTDTY